VSEEATEHGTEPSRDVPCADLPLAHRVEAVLLAADRPMADGRIADVLGLELGAPQVRAAIEELNADYERTGRSFRIEQVAGGRQVMTVSALGPVVARLRGERAQARLTQAALETLAVVAYRQPILRADIEAIRGVACGEVLRSLMERRMVRIVGRSEEIGRPMLYGTTGEFLRTFGIASISDLPQAKDLKAP
jgi:segregation and condensation protein B